MGVQAFFGGINLLHFLFDTDKHVPAVAIVDSDGNAGSSAAIGKVDHTTGSLGHGHKEVAATGTPEALAASTAAKWVMIQAYASNTGRVAIGGADTVSASASAGTGTGVVLLAGEKVTLPVDNLADVYLAVSVNGEGVRYLYGAA